MRTLHRVGAVRAPVDRAEDLKRLYRVIGNDERMTAVLKRQSSQ
jgi:hypothetical protein